MLTIIFSTLISSHQEFKAILTKMTLILFSVTGIIASLLGLWQIKVSFPTLLPTLLTCPVSN